jgi:intracellular multiplication protein IcmB
MAIASIIDQIYNAIATYSRKSLSSFCFIETTDGGDNLVSQDGSLATVIRVDGVRQLMGDDELGRVVDDMNIRLSSYLGQPGHAIQVWFARDPDLSSQMLKNMMVPSRNVARNLGLALDDLFDERERHLTKFITWEGFYIVLWTRPAVLTKQELETVRKSRKAPDLWPSSVDTQNIFHCARQILVRHDAFVKSFVADLNKLHIRSEAINGHEAIRAIKWSVYPDMTGSEWRPVLPGDAVMPRLPEIGGQDVSHLFCPKLQDQIFDREAEVVNPRIVRIGRYYFANLDMTVGPQDVRKFSELMERLQKLGEFPWRVSYLIEGDGLGGAMQINNTLAAVMGITNTTENRQIRDSIKYLQALKQRGSVIVRYRVSFCTWAPATDYALIEERASQLQRAVETWGYCTVSGTSGDPLAGAFSTALSLDVASTAPTAAPPLSDVIYMLPWNRDASPWRTGSVLFRTPDGRPWPFQPGSSLQDTFIDLIFAPPGKGKSVYMNSTNLALCLSAAATSGAGGAQLPRIAIIDIGPSSSGLISLIKEALPPHRRHEAQYKRLRMIKDHAINPFDTQLGCRRPFPLERSFLVNFLSVLGTPVGETKPPSGLSDLAGLLVDELYEMFDDRSRKGTPRPYTRGEDANVDKAIDKYNIVLVEDETWWGVVDKLFAAEDYHSATMAQRYAVPRIEDLGTVIRSNQVLDIFGGAKTANGESLIDVFQRMVSTGLREYPILTLPTRFDIGDSRIVSLDLDEAAPRGGGPADKQTALVYMLARFALAKDFYLNEELVGMIPDDFREYHRVRIKRIRETPKRIVFDEFHRTRATPVVREQVIIDMREGRKWNVHIALASQQLADFDKEMVDMASGVWIMGVSTERAANEAAAIFGLTPTAVHVIKHYLNGPGPGGAPFLAILNLKDGRHEHVLVNTLGPMELWAFSTTAEDAGLRNRLYGLCGPIEARRRLAKRFPGGSAKREVEERIMRMAEQGKNTDEAAEGVIETLARELMELKMD